MWIGLELHCHTRHSSDGLPDPADVLRRAGRLGLGAVAITDHDSMSGSREAASIEVPGVTLIPAVEVSSLAGDILALYVSRPVAAGLGAAETAVRIRDQGGIVICPHPFDRSRKCACDPSRLDPALWDGVEVPNAATKDRASLSRALEFATAHGLPVVAGSDAHTLCGIGSATTWLDLPGGEVTRETVGEAIRAGRILVRGSVFSRPTRFLEDLAKRSLRTRGEEWVRAIDRRLALA